MNELKLTPEIIKKLSIKIDSFIDLWLLSIGETPIYDKIMELTINSYIYPGGKITKKGLDLINSVNSKEVDVSNKWHDLHKSLENLLIKLTSKKQVKANGGYSFLCNEIDLQHKLTKVIRKYKLTDWNKIVKLLHLHVEKAHKQKFDKVFLIQYYIEKNGTSTLASDYKNFIEEKEETKKEQLQNTKELF